MMGQQGTRKKQSSFDWKNCGSTLCRHIVEVILSKCDHLWKAPSHTINTTFKTTLRNKQQF